MADDARRMQKFYLTARIYLAPEMCYTENRVSNIPIFARKDKQTLNRVYLFYI